MWKRSFALFSALLRSFALFCGLAFALFCTHLPSFALICVFLRTTAFRTTTQMSSVCETVLSETVLGPFRNKHDSLGWRQVSSMWSSHEAHGHMITFVAVQIYYQNSCQSRSSGCISFSLGYPGMLPYLVLLRPQIMQIGISF